MDMDYPRPVLERSGGAGGALFVSFWAWGGGRPICRPAGYDAVAGGQHIWIWRAKYSSSLKETAD
jgi:hypothetical protein